MVQEIIDAFGDESDYEKVQELREKLAEHGYTFEVGLDGVPFNFTPQCSCCENPINENYGIYYNNNGDHFCESCESDAWQYASSVLVAKDGEIRKHLWCSDFGFRDTEWWEESSPNGVSGFKYVKTDAWRGYWDPIIEDGYITLASGWSTGRYEDVSWKHTFNDFVEQIAEGEYCPYEIVFAFGLTSNVFSVASDVIIKEADLEGFTEWLGETIGITPEQLKTALK